MRNKILKICLSAMTFFLPLFLHADVLVTEVAWMGTVVSANDEWIELHNSGSAAVSLSGWTLNATDGTPSINLSGSIGAGEYKLLERTDDTTFPGIAALLIFTGALGNEGESLTLKNGATTIQSMSFSSGWPAGDVTSKQTMQWTGSAWVTAPETAGSVTTATDDGGDDDTGDDDDTTGDDDDTTGDDDSEADDDTEPDTSSPSNKTAAPTRKIYEDMVFELDFPKRAIAGSPIEFKAQALDLDRTKMKKGKYIFNMGDGTIRTYTKDWEEKGSGFIHTYEHPGSYLIKIKYYITYFEGVAPEVEDSFLIEVSAPTITITKVYPDGGIEMKNTSSNEIDISNWQLKAAGKTFNIPEDSVIMPGKTVVFPQKVHKLSTGGGVTLLTPTGALAFSYGSPVAKVATVSKSTTSKSIKEEAVSIGEVLGAETALATTDEEINKGKKEKSTLVWVLSFVILILLSVIAVLFLKKDEKGKDEYELIDE